jgi:hypothetical protein
MGKLTTSTCLLYGGIAAMILAVVLLVVFLCVFSRKNRRLKRTLDEEFGEIRYSETGKAGGAAKADGKDHCGNL